MNVFKSDHLENGERKRGRIEKARQSTDRFVQDFSNDTHPSLPIAPRLSSTEEVASEKYLHPTPPTNGSWCIYVCGNTSGTHHEIVAKTIGHFRQTVRGQRRDKHDICPISKLQTRHGKPIAQHRSEKIIRKEQITQGQSREQGVKHWNHGSTPNKGQLGISSCCHNIVTDFTSVMPLLQHQTSFLREGVSVKYLKYNGTCYGAHSSVLPLIREASMTTKLFQ